MVSTAHPFPQTATIWQVLKYALHERWLALMSVVSVKSFVHVQNCKWTNELSGGCPLIVRSQSVLFGTCPLPVQYSCGSHPFIFTCPVLVWFTSVHIQWSSLCVPRWRLKGNVMDKTPDKRTSTAHIPKEWYIRSGVCSRRLLGKTHNDKVEVKVKRFMSQPLGTGLSYFSTRNTKKYNKNIKKQKKYRRNISIYIYIM